MLPCEYALIPFDTVGNTRFFIVFFIRNHFISNVVLDSLKFKKLLEVVLFTNFRADVKLGT